MDSMRSLLSTSDFLQVREHKLSNDLTVWLNEDHSQPKIFGAVVVKAGAKDSPNTGIAHYFEHMMFKGTDKIGTIDYESEKVLLDIIAEKYDALADTEDPKMRAHLQQIINDLSVRAAEYVIPNDRRTHHALRRDRRPQHAHCEGIPMTTDRKSTRLNSSHPTTSRMPSSA